MADGVDPKEEAKAALHSLELGIEAQKEERRRPRRPRWFEILIPVMVTLVGAGLVLLSLTIGWLPLPFLLILAIVTLFTGLLLVIVGLKSLPRTITAFLSSEARVPSREEGETRGSSGDDARR